MKRRLARQFRHRITNTIGPLFFLILTARAGAAAPLIEVTVGDLFRPASSFADEGFGHALDVDGTRVIVGVDGDDDSIDPNHWSRAEVWKRLADGSWSIDLAGILTPSYPRSGNDYFARGVAISGKTAIVGRPANSDGADKGSAFIFEFGTTLPQIGWKEKTEVVPAGATSGNFGSRVAIDGDMAVVCAPGYVRVFQRDSGGMDNWGEIGSFDSSIHAGFGCSDVAIDGNWVAIGHGLFDGPMLNSGLIYLFQYTGGINPWTPHGPIGPASPPSDYFLGHRIGISVLPDQLILLAATTNGYGIKAWKRPLGDGFLTDGTIDDPAVISFGKHLDLDGRSMLVSGTQYSSTQRVNLYRRQGGPYDGSWRHGATFTHELPSNPQAFGAPLGLSAGLMIAGSPEGDVTGISTDEGWVSHLDDSVFIDGFESGNVTNWSGSAP